MKPSIVSAAALLLVGCASTAQTPAVAQETPNISSYLSDKTHSIDGQYFIGPQPTAADLAALKEAGVTKVISFRTPAEMEKLAFSQPALLSELGMGYDVIPVGGDAYGYTPAQMSALDAALSDSDAEGKVLLHCGSGYRASIIMVAWLVQEQGMSLDDAITHAEGWWPLGLEKVLGRKLTVGFANE